MSVTTALAVYGAALSTITAAIALLRERQNRPNLRATLHEEFCGPDSPDPEAPYANIVVELVNAGRHPTAVVQVMVIWDPPDGPGEVLLDRDDPPRILGGA